MSHGDGSVPTDRSGVTKRKPTYCQSGSWEGAWGVAYGVPLGRYLGSPMQYVPHSPPGSFKLPGVLG